MYRSFLFLVFFVLASSQSWAQFNIDEKIYSNLDSIWKYKDSVVAINLASNGRKVDSDNLVGLIDLQYVDLSHNQIKSFPYSMASSNKLLWLNLEGNRIDTLPKLGNLFPKLQHLNLSYNPISPDLDFLEGLEQMNVLKLNGCGLEDLPDHTSKLGHLEHLELVANNISSCPGVFKEMVKLKKLNLRNNYGISFLDLYYGLPPNLEIVDVRHLPLTAIQLAKLKGKYPSLRNIFYKIDTVSSYRKLGDIPAPEEYQRLNVKKNSFAKYVRDLPIVPFQRPILLHDGKLKPQQFLHEEIIGVSINNNEFQQCADVAIRIFSDYQYQKDDKGKIEFKLSNGFNVPYNKWRKGYRVKVQGNKTSWTKSAKEMEDSLSYISYLDFIFMYAGSFSLSNSLGKTKEKKVKPGDLLVTGGFPGHVAIIGDVAFHPETGEKVVLIIQGNTPAQEIELVRNINDAFLSPWFKLPLKGQMLYPRRSFDEFDLMKF